MFPGNPVDSNRRKEDTLNSSWEASVTEKASAAIQQVHDIANEKYRATKKRKQQDLFHKIEDAQLSGDRQRIKNQKKKVDNHASAVASRVRHEFLVESFEKLVRDKMVTAARLEKQLIDKNTDLAAKDSKIRTLSQEISALLINITHYRKQDAALTSKDAEILALRNKIDALTRKISLNHVQFSPQSSVGASTEESQNQMELLPPQDYDVQSRREPMSTDHLPMADLSSTKTYPSCSPADGPQDHSTATICESDMSRYMHCIDLMFSQEPESLPGDEKTDHPANGEFSRGAIFDFPAIKESIKSEACQDQYYPAA